MGDVPTESLVSVGRGYPAGVYTLRDVVREEECHVIDPVCGMDVDPEDAAAAWQHAGTAYYFCSVGCMERFREDPERFLAGDPGRRSM